MKSFSSLFIIIYPHNTNNSMTQSTQPALFQWLSKISYVLLFLLLIHAAYIAIIGGAVKFILFSFITLLILITSKFQHIFYKVILGILSLGSAFYLLMYKHDSVLPLGLVIAYIVGFFFINSSYRIKLRTMAFLGLFIIIGFYQFSYFQNLKSHYAQYKTTETWQKYGAL